MKVDRSAHAILYIRSINCSNSLFCHHVFWISSATFVVQSLCSYLQLSVSLSAFEQLHEISKLGFLAACCFPMNVSNNWDGTSLLCKHKPLLPALCFQFFLLQLFIHGRPSFPGHDYVAFFKTFDCLPCWIVPMWEYHHWLKEIGEDPCLWM